MGDFKKLKVWHEAHELTMVIYTMTSEFPGHETYGLVAQMRRAAVSIGSNIAEGYGRVGDRELSRYLRIALGSLSELEYQMLLARDLGYVSDSDYRNHEASLLRLKRRLIVFSKKVQEDIK